LEASYKQLLLGVDLSAGAPIPRVRIQLIPKLKLIESR